MSDELCGVGRTKFHCAARIEPGAETHDSSLMTHHLSLSLEDETLRTRHGRFDGLLHHPVLHR